MSSKPQKPAPAAAPEVVAELPNGTSVLTKVPDGVMTADQITKAAIASANSELMLGKIAEFGDRFRALGERHPEYAERLEYLATYCDSNVEGMVEERLPPLSFLQMRQAMSKSAPEKSKQGDFYSKSGDILGTDFVLVPVLYHRKRAYFVQGKDRPECVSNDGDVGSKHGNCSLCPYGRYVEGEKSLCSAGHSITFLTEKLNEIYTFDFMKTSAKNGKKLVAMMKSPVFAKKYRMTSEKETNKQGAFYVAQAVPTGEATEGVEFEIAREVAAFVRLRYEYYRARRTDAAAARGQLQGGAAAGQLGAGGASNADSTDVPDV